MNLKAPFPYFGGKSKIADIVWEAFGSVDNYVEPFFGSGAVLLCRPGFDDSARWTETVNDDDGFISNFWRALRDDPDNVAFHADWPVNECVVGDTIISTPSGSRKIKTLSPGDIVWGESNGEIIPSIVTATKKSLATELCNFNGLLITLNHPIWTASGYYPVNELRHDDILAMICGNERQSPQLDYLCIKRSAHNAGTLYRGDISPNNETFNRTSVSRKETTENASGLLDMASFPIGDKTDSVNLGIRTLDGLAGPRKILDCMLSQIRRSRESYRWGRRNTRAEIIAGANRKSTRQIDRSEICAWEAERNAWETSHRRGEIKNRGGERWQTPYIIYPKENVNNSSRSRHVQMYRGFDYSSERKTSFSRTPHEDRRDNSKSTARDMLGNWRKFPINNGSRFISKSKRGVCISSYSQRMSLQRSSFRLRYPIEVFNLQTTTGNYFADRILVHNCDLESRHLWLVNHRKEITEKLADPDFYDAKAAGWWVWGISCWIGGGWCSGKGPWVWDENKRIVNRQRPHLGGDGQGVNRQRPHLGDDGHGIRDYLNALAKRLRYVRVCCGDWSRICGPTPTTGFGLTAVFLDPPYTDKANRDSNIYALDSESVGHDVFAWCLKNGDNPLFRIALCGYEGEYELPGWRCHTWKASGGYENQSQCETSGNCKKERIWFSPHCLDKELNLFS